LCHLLAIVRWQEMRQAREDAAEVEDEGQEQEFEGDDDDDCNEGNEDDEEDATPIFWLVWIQMTTRIMWITR